MIIEQTSFPSSRIVLQLLKGSLSSAAYSLNCGTNRMFWRMLWRLKVQMDTEGNSQIQGNWGSSLEMKSLPFGPQELIARNSEDQ